MRTVALKITLEDLEKVDENLSIVLRKGKLEDLIKIIKEKYKSIRQFSIVLNCSLGFLNDMVTGRRMKSFRLKFLRKMEDCLEIDLSNFIEKITCRFRPNCFIYFEDLPIRGTPSLANLVGHTMGDGHIGPISFQFSNKNDVLISDLIRKVKELPVKNITFNKRFNKGVNIQFSKLVRNILIVAGAPRGNKVESCFETPQWIKDGGLDIKKGFIRALFDDEAYIGKCITLTMHKREELVSNLELFLKELQIILKEFNIVSNLSKGALCVTQKGVKSIRLRLNIHGFQNIQNFEENIGFSHSDKIESLEKYIDSTRNYWLRRYKNQIRIMELLKERRRLNTTELSKEIGKTRRHTADNLRKLEKIDVVSRIRVEDKTKPHIWFLKNPENFKQF